MKNTVQVLHAQAQQATTDLNDIDNDNKLTQCSFQLYTHKGQLNYVNWPASCSKTFSYRCWKFVV